MSDQPFMCERCERPLFEDETIVAPSGETVCDDCACKIHDEEQA